ncbi:hypothetical protein, partial [Salmonella enterica]|uniref:hypothetical protein n=1 Tax=Salmonella enterica TaxID=28901 RepID=UPI003CFB4233
NAIPAGTTIAEFRCHIALGATSRTVLVDAQNRYAGIVQTPTAYGENVDFNAAVGTLAVNVDAALAPTMDIAEV